MRKWVRQAEVDAGGRARVICEIRRRSAGCGVRWLICVYGAHKVWLQLNRKGIAVARCTMERLMRDMDWPAPASAVGRRRHTTIPDPTGTRSTDLVDRQFTPNRPDRLGWPTSPT
jgi:putative transposase